MPSLWQIGRPFCFRFEKSGDRGRKSAEREKIPIFSGRRPPPGRAGKLGAPIGRMRTIKRSGRENDQTRWKTETFSLFKVHLGGNCNWKCFNEPKRHTLFGVSINLRFLFTTNPGSAHQKSVNKFLKLTPPTRLMTRTPLVNTGALKGPSDEKLKRHFKSSKEKRERKKKNNLSSQRSPFNAIHFGTHQRDTATLTFPTVFCRAPKSGFLAPKV